MLSKLEISNIIIQKLEKNKKDLINFWNNPKATSTKHLYIDNLLPIKFCEEIYKAFPKSDNSFFIRNSFRERKKTCANLNDLPNILSEITYAFQDLKIIKLIEEITSMSKLEPDEKLYAGGLSLMSEGDFLNPHIDNSHDRDRKKYRRLNLLYYVSPNWKISYGGNFELWDNKVEEVKTITSKFNRLVVMETNKTSWHSVSKVKINAARCCVSNYYFSELPPKNSKNRYFHVTSFLGRPNQRLRRLFGKIDNILRNTVSQKLHVGRGKKLINKIKNDSN